MIADARGIRRLRAPTGPAGILGRLARQRPDARSLRAATYGHRITRLLVFVTYSIRCLLFCASLDPEITMNTPRQPNVRTPIERIPGEIRSSGHYGRTSTSFNTALATAPKPITTIFIATETSRPPVTDEPPSIVPAK
jgi:hypothetical protein